MADIRPFLCVHPEKSLVRDIAALPYDVYNRQEARREVKGHPLSFLNIDRPETQFPADYDMYAPEVYQKAADLLQTMIANGQFVREKTPGYWLYELTMNGRAQTGIVGCASIDDYMNGVIMKHENTRAEKELDRIHHVDACSAQTGPIFLTYRQDQLMNQRVEAMKQAEPFFDFVSEDGIRHRGWCIDDPECVMEIRTFFEKTDKIYIADGHHRAASAVKVGLQRRDRACGKHTEKPESDYFLSVAFPDQQLYIMDYNRVVRDLNLLSEEAFLQKIEEKCILDKGTKAGLKNFLTKKGRVGLYLSGQWYYLTFREEFCSCDPVNGLDVSVLQNEILHPVLGIQDPKTDKRIDFVGGIRGLDELERRVHTDCAAAFAMVPTSISELFSVADAGRLMPPKSTWFEPKLRSGLFIHLM